MQKQMESPFVILNQINHIAWEKMYLRFLLVLPL